MGFSITYSGSVGAVYNIEVAAGAVVHIGGGSHNHSQGKFSGDTCPTKVTKAQRTEWGTACAADHEAPEGWTAETFSSEKAFSNNTIPTGLNKGDTIFYWKKGVGEDDVPNGFIAVHGTEDIIVIVPVSSEIEADDDDDSADSSLDGENDDFKLPPSTNIVDNDDNDDLYKINDDDEEEGNSPF